ncbi:MAG: glutamyl-tRNA reductase [Lachnospiraceae bacterium]|nr:glutamyl-tRNA reductase [Lachnospiraceae bacterium]
MILWMTGIDYEKADIDTREIFSFQKHSAELAMEQLKETYGFSGVILLSTCNRTELYVSTDEAEGDLFQMFCELKKVPFKEYEPYKVERSGEEAVDHLFRLACGMKSKIFGEDQIISQIRTGLFQAREIQTVDSYLEKVFQTAIATAKKVKTEVHLTSVKTSVVEEMLTVLKREAGELGGKQALVIGNGEVGRLSAMGLLKEGMKVTMTLRNYKTRQIEIPEGCETIDYKDRYQGIGSYDLVVSATTSPHHTIKYEDSHALFEDGKEHILVDLAVPRDISSRYGTMENIRLYNIDTLGGGNQNRKDDELLSKALSIIKEQEEELALWQNFRVHIPTVQTMGQAAGMVTYQRIEKNLKKLVESSKQEEVKALVEQAAEKTITSMLFDLRKNLPMEYWQVCIEALAENIQ